MDGQSEEHKGSQRLSVLGKHIWLMFELLSRSNLQHGLPGYSSAAWEHEADRFSLWASNLGLHHRGHSSLDYRLREAVALERIIGGLLDDLKTSLEERMSKISSVFIWEYYLQFQPGLFMFITSTHADILM